MRPLVRPVHDRGASDPGRAHRLGKWTAAHAHGTQGIERAVRAGADYIAHVSFVSATGRSEFDPRLAEEMARVGVYVDCTVTAHLPALIARDTSFAPPVRLLWEHGVRIVAGHDAGIPASPQRAYVGGLKALEAVGLPRTEVLLAATSRATAAIGRAGVTGVLAPGFEADLIAVTGDPRRMRLLSARRPRIRSMLCTVTSSGKSPPVASATPRALSASSGMKARWRPLGHTSRAAAAARRTRAPARPVRRARCARGRSGSGQGSCL
ncbi:amidohydrolase family protein [uncultured Actinomyces sp.]|uniref:amidohydrolase family protein n=1 Tax=uncultured Actinomyces sp. TaxID=249061 RepID=UPI00288B3A63|nr:amidohydrolase family protein [uncultured Actinomyces sp.]